MNEAYQRVREVQVSANEVGQRLDNFLIKTLKGVPKSRVYRIVRKGEVRVNKGRVKADYRLQMGDVVRIPPIRVAETPSAPDARWLERGQVLEQNVLVEDEYVMVINKPSGWAVHGGSGVAFGVIEVMRALRPNQPFLELGHRLDRETSGCLMLAKQRDVLLEFHQLLKQGNVDKVYRALLVGEWKGGARRVEAQLSRQQGQKVRVDEGGKEADSSFTPVKRFDGYTEVSVDIGTGRTHQIRVHADYLGLPVAGDRKYGDFERNRALKQQGLTRLFLHAATLRFRLPRSGRVYDAKAPLPDDLQQLLKTLTS